MLKNEVELRLNSLDNKKADYINNILTKANDYIKDIELGPAQAFVVYWHPNESLGIRFVYTSLSRGVRITKEMQEDRYDYSQLVNRALSAIIDDIKIHQTPNTKLVKRMKNIELSIYQNLDTKDIYLTFYFRVMQIPNGLDELKDWNTQKKEGQDIDIINK